MNTILIVDDSTTQLDLMKNYLDFPELKIVTLENSERVLETAKTIEPSLIITDLVMPGWSGLELCRQLKRDPQVWNIPIIVCSTKNRDIDRKWAFKQGAKQYLVKPFERKDLISAVSNFIEITSLKSLQFAVS